MEKIKEIVEYLDIPKKREELRSAKKEIISIKSKMNNLTYYHNVAEYAYALDSLNYLNSLPETDQLVLQEEFEKISRITSALTTDEHVREYIRLANRIKELEAVIGNYHQTINTDLRTELLDLELPDFYVYQGFLTKTKDYKLCRHLIVPNTILTFVDPKEIATLISQKSLEYSNHKAKKFYNQVSYRYLEGLTQDYSFGLENKNLGDVNILRRGR